MTDLRRYCEQQGLDQAEAAPDPIEQFMVWYRAAVEAGAQQYDAMTLATATAEGRPSARMVLLKDVDARGFVFLTNFESRKARELAENPWGALVFWWYELHRQVRVEGDVSRIPSHESDAHFALRPRENQLGTWASRQSEIIGDRTHLERRLAEENTRFAGDPVTRPPYWGGYRLRPHLLEFWQGRPHRLHDRLRYRRVGDAWVIERLSP